MEKPEVIFFQRKPNKFGNFSVEYIFKDVRERLTNLITPVLKISKYESTGILKRIYNIIEAALNQGEVNHVTGDVTFLSLLLTKRRTVLTILDCVFMERYSGLKKFLLWLFFLKLPIWRSKYVTVISEATKREVLKFVKTDPKKIFIIPVAISSIFQPFPKNFNKKKTVLLQIGVAENKNIERLLEAIKDIPCHLEIIGNLPIHHKERLKELKIEHNITWNISDEEMFQKYKNCDILTFVSTYEGFGMPILEANAVGRAVLTSNVYSMSEVADNAACLVNPFEVKSIKNGLLKIINDDEYRDQLIANGYENKKRFDPDIIAKMYYKIYDKIFKENRK